MKKPSLKRFIFLAVIFAALFFTWSCDSDSNSTTSAPQTMTPATMDQTTAETAAVMTMSTGAINDVSDTFVDEIRSAAPDTQPAKSLASWALARLRKEVLSRRVANEQDERRSGSNTESGSCDEAGTYTASVTWDGPDPLTDLCDASNITATSTFSNCQEFDESLNGVCTITLTGNLCAPSSTSFDFSNFSYADFETEIIALSMQMSLTEMEYSGEVLTHLTTTFNGDIYLNTRDISLDMEFRQYAIDMSINGSDQTTTISGSFTGSCMDGWVTITTLDPILTNDSSECPVGGRVRLSGKSDIIVIFNSDGSMTVGEESFDSCEDENLPDECQSNK